MTTNELIAELKRLDPEGGITVCVGRHTVAWLDREPAYYDGCLCSLQRDGSGRYISGKVCSKGLKIRLITWGIEDQLYEDPDLPVDLSDLMEPSLESWKATIEEWRELARELAREVDREVDSYLSKTDLEKTENERG